MDKYRKFEFASLRNSKLTDGFWGKRTDNYMEIIQCMLEALLCPTNSARLINFEIAAGERKEWVQKIMTHPTDRDIYIHSRQYGLSVPGDYRRGADRTSAASGPYPRA